MSQGFAIAEHKKSALPAAKRRYRWGFRDDRYHDEFIRRDDVTRSERYDQAIPI